jgi:integrase
LLPGKTVARTKGVQYKTQQNNGANLGFERKLWQAADKLRGNMDAAEYKHVVLGLVFLKYISDAFEERHAALERKTADASSEYYVREPAARYEVIEDRDEYASENVFWVPREARWSYLQANAKQPTIGKLIDDAMVAIEKENESLKGVLPKDYARPSLDKQRLGEVVDLIGTIGLGDAENRSKDIIGRVYEYFLGQFASAEGKKGGQFYTPRCVVRLLVEMIEPFKGRVYDPCCGQLNKLYADLLARGLSPRSVQYTHVTAHKALADAVKWQLLARNVADSATAPRPQSKEPKTWTASDLRAFLDHVEGDRLYAAYLLAGSTGLRRGELLGLRWRDVDMTAGRLAVVQTLLQVNNKLAFGTPKTAKGRRSVALDTHTVDALRAHRRAQVAERLAWGPGYQDADLVFAREDGVLLHPDGFSRAFNRHAKAAALPVIRFHDLRHTHATLALQAGVHPKVVSERLGHATVSITLDTYSHAIPAMQEAAAQTVADLVFANG